MQQGQEVKVQITDINHQGEGVGRVEGLVVFVPGTVPGEQVTARIVERQKKFACGKLLTLDSTSEHRQTPTCRLSENCGGCNMQHIAYTEQLRLKTELVKQNIARLGGITGAPVHDIIGMENPWHYRNNVQFKIQRIAGEVSLGFFAPETHSLIAATDSNKIMCLLAHQEINQVAEQIRDILNLCPAGFMLPAEIMLRRGSTGQVMVVLINDTVNTEEYSKIAGKIIGITGVTSVMEYTRLRGKNPGGRYNVLAGQAYIEDELDGLRFRISASSFYQVNPVQTAELYRQALNLCALQGREQVADAYCGVGTIALYVARYAGAVRGYEVVPGAVQDAQSNAELNGLGNTNFFRGAVERVLPEHVAQGYKPDVVVLDPPRSGCREEVLKAIAQSGARRIVYVSCNPATLARDAGRLIKSGYTLQAVQPVDMFPHTGHVETVVLIERK